MRCLRQIQDLPQQDMASTDFNKWPEFSKFILVMLMLSGACAGSTGGGMKVSRLVIMLKTVKK